MVVNSKSAGVSWNWLHLNCKVLKTTCVRLGMYPTETSNANTLRLPVFHLKQSIMWNLYIHFRGNVKFPPWHRIYFPNKLLFSNFLFDRSHSVLFRIVLVLRELTLRTNITFVEIITWLKYITFPRCLPTRICSLSSQYTRRVQCKRDKCMNLLAHIYALISFLFLRYPNC